MLNFATLFNQFRSQSNNGLGDLLDQPAIKMGRLLDQDSFLNEYKSSNPRVIQFMKYERFEELVEFVTIVGSADDKKRGYKYPLSACDILSIDNTTAIEYFFPDRPLTSEEKVQEEVEVEVQIEVEEEPEPVKQEVFVEPIKAQQPEKIEQKQIIQAPDEKNSVAVQKQVEEPTQTNEAIDAQQINETKVTEQVETHVEIEILQKMQEEKPVPAIPQPQKIEEKIEPIISQKKMKKVLKKEKKMIQKIIKRQREPLNTKLMSYFDEEVNYTLAGYVCRILSTFFTKKPIDVMKYLLEENNFEKILNHAESRSVGELLIKILTNQTTAHLQKRRQCYKAILNKMSLSSQIFILSNVSNYVCEIIQKISNNLKGANKIIQFNSVFFSLDIVQQVIHNVMSDDENISVYNAPILFTYLTNVPFVLPEDQTIIQDFRSLLAGFIQKSCEKLQVKVSSRPKLGTGRIKIIEILRFILKENVLNSKDIIARREDFFSIILNLMKQYQMNNMLHNQLIKIIEIALTEKQNSPLNNAILKDNILVTLIQDEAAQDKKIKSGQSVYLHRKGYIAHIINLAMKLKELAESNQNIKKAVESAQFINTYESFIEKEIFNNRKSLAGFSMRKDLKHEIMFQKEDIIAAYVTFLQKCPSPIFEKTQEEDLINIEHPDLVQQLQKQLEQNLTIKNKEEVIHTSPEKSKEPTVQTISNPDYPITEAEVLAKPTYWSIHLQYNVDELVFDS